MDNGFLFWSLFFPRIVLTLYYTQNWIPANFIPFWGDFFMAVFIPRVLVLIYIYQNIGANNGWFIAHVIFLILAYAGGSETTRKSTK